MWGPDLALISPYPLVFTGVEVLLPAHSNPPLCSLQQTSMYLGTWDSPGKSYICQSSGRAQDTAGVPKDMKAARAAFLRTGMLLQAGSHQDSPILPSPLRDLCSRVHP